MNERASILPAVLISISVAFALMLPISQQTIRILRKSAEEKIAFSLNSTCRSTALIKNFYKPIQYSTIFSCTKESNKHSWIFTDCEFCKLQLKSSNLKLPLIQFSNASLKFDLLNNLPIQPCWQAAVEISPALKLDSGYFSTHICAVDRQQLENPLQIKSNLSVKQQLNVTQSTALSVKGFFHVGNLNFIQRQNFRLFAAGEILIDSISSQDFLKLEIISGSGSVKINRITGPIRISVFSRSTAKLPANSIYSTDDFDQLKLEDLAIGFS